MRRLEDEDEKMVSAEREAMEARMREKEVRACRPAGGRSGRVSSRSVPPLDGPGGRRATDLLRLFGHEHGSEGCYAAGRDQPLDLRQVWKQNRDGTSEKTPSSSPSTSETPRPRSAVFAMVIRDKSVRILISPSLEFPPHLGLGGAKWGASNALGE